MSYLVLACTGLDKPEGSVAREVAVRLAEEDGAGDRVPRGPQPHAGPLPEGSGREAAGGGRRLRHPVRRKLAASAGAKPSYMAQVSETVKRLDFGRRPVSVWARTVWHWRRKSSMRS